MSIQTPATLLKNVRSRKFPTVYLCAGENHLEKKRFFDELVSNLFPEGVSPFDHDVFSLPGPAVNDIVSSALILPFGVKKRLVQVKYLNLAHVSFKKNLSTYLDHIPCSTILFLETSEIKKKLQTTPLAKAVEKYGELVYFNMPRNEELPAVVSQAILHAGKKISPEAARFVAEGAKDEYARMMQEIDKLLIFCADKNVIGLKEAAEISGQPATHNTFELRDALQAKNTKKSIDILQNLFHSRVEPVLIIYSLYHTYRRLLMAKLMIDRHKVSAEQVRHALKINAYFDRHYFSDLHHFKIDELVDCMEKISEADVMIKTGKADPQDILTALLFEFTGFKQLV